MSVEAVRWVLDHCPLLAVSHALALLALAERADVESGICWPSIADVARRCRVSRDRAKHLVRDLIEWGYLRLERRGGNGPADPNAYRFDLSETRDLGASWQAGEIGKRAKGDRGTPLCDEAAEIPGDGAERGIVEPGKGDRTTEVRGIVQPGKGDRSTPQTIREQGKNNHKGTIRRLGALFDSGDSPDPVGRNDPPAQTRIRLLLAEHGVSNDAEKRRPKKGELTFPDAVCRMADVKIIEKVAAEYDRRNGQNGGIGNPGGWWRTALRREGVPGI